MAKPRRSTLDEFVDQFDAWDVETQERVMDQLAMVQRLTKRRAKVPPNPNAPVTTGGSEAPAQGGNTQEALNAD